MNSFRSVRSAAARRTCSSWFRRMRGIAWIGFQDRHAFLFANDPDKRARTPEPLAFVGVLDQDRAEFRPGVPGDQFLPFDECRWQHVFVHVRPALEVVNRDLQQSGIAVDFPGDDKPGHRWKEARYGAGGARRVIGKDRLRS